MLIAVTNRSHIVTDAEASTMARAVDWQARHHIAPAWRLDTPTVRFYHDEADVPADAIPAPLIDSPDVANALGYHDVDPAGRPFIRCFVEPVVHAPGGAVLTGELSLASVLSHEVAEWLGDAPCNRWAQRPDGRLIALELGDPVQGSSYAVTVTTGRRKQAVTVSNFVHPAWFDQHPPRGARFDQLGRVAAPFTLDAGGYQIWTDGKTVGNEFGSRAAAESFAALANLKAHPASRSARRLAAAARLVAA